MYGKWGDWPGAPHTFQTKEKGCHSFPGQSHCQDPSMWVSSLALNVLLSWLASAAGPHCHPLLETPPASPHSQKWVGSLDTPRHSGVPQTCPSVEQIQGELDVSFPLCSSLLFLLLCLLCQLLTQVRCWHLLCSLMCKVYCFGQTTFWISASPFLKWE